LVTVLIVAKGLPRFSRPYALSQEKSSSKAASILAMLWNLEIILITVNYWKIDLSTVGRNTSPCLPSSLRTLKYWSPWTVNAGN
jgi:hypothetical protein